MGRVKLLAAAALVAATAPTAIGGGIVTPAADAHADCAYRYYDGVAQYRGKACNRSSGHPTMHFSHWVDGCDGYTDGLRVRAWAVLQSYSSDPWPGNWDPNGASSGCANDQYTSLVLYGHKICVEQPAGCSGWLWH